jgi:virginiamycin B lyase
MRERLMRTSSRLLHFGTVAPRAPRWVSRPWLSLAAAIIALAWPVCAGAQATFVKLPTPTADPLGVAPGPDGNIWVTENVGNKIAQITPSGAVTEFKVPTADSGPYGITPGPDGNLWFTELTAGKIGRITTAGVITQFPVPSGNGAGPITTGPDGNLWFGEPSGNMVGRATTAGVITEFALPAESGPGGPTGIAAGPDGAIWFTLPGLNSIGRITTDGSTTNVFPIPTAGSGPQAIVPGPDGSLWFTESNVSQIGQITTDPQIHEYPLSAGNFPFGIAPGAQGTMWFTAPGSNGLFQFIPPLLIEPTGTQPSFTGFVLPQSCGPSAIAPVPLTWSGIAFTCADTTFNSIGEAVAILPNVTLTVTQPGEGGGRVFSQPFGIDCFSGTQSPPLGQSCSASFPSGQQVVLAPISRASTAGIFAGWNLPPASAVPGCSGTSPCQISLTTDTTVSATFNPASGSKELSVTLGGLNLYAFSTPSGIFCSSIVSRPSANCTNAFPTGTTVELIAATPQGADVAFAGWSGGGCSGTEPCFITLVADTQVTALVGPATSGGSIPVNAAAATLPTGRNDSVENMMTVRRPTAAGGSIAPSGATDTVTIFGTMINTLSETATNCAVQPSPLANLPGPFVYQTTNPATNALTGTANTPVDIPAGASQSFVLAFTPTLPFGPIDVPLIFSCANLLAAPSVPGLDTVLLAASATPVPDVIALGATATNDQTLHITGSTGSGAFAVASINLGAGDTMTVGADTGVSGIPVSISLCQTNPQSGQCISAIGPSVTTQINPNDTPTFGIFVTALDTVNFDPTDNRINVSFFDSTGTQRGGTSVAVETQ